MAAVLLVAAGPLVTAPPASAAEQWHLSAPAATITATVALDGAGRLSLAVSRGGTQVLRASAMGIRTTTADLGSGLVFAGRSDVRVVERYNTMTGRRRAHTVDANETTLRFTKGTERLDVVIRMSAGGVAYRYVLPRTGQIGVTGEATEFAVPTTAAAYLLPYDNGRNDYESIHVHTTVTAASPVAYGYPSLFRVGDSWLLITESDISGNYGASRLTLDETTRRFRLTLPDTQENSTGPLRTPWRTMIVGDLATVVESDLVTDLATPSKVADPSWIRPGRSAWSWWSDGPSSRDPVAQRRFVDYAARLGWEYILVDAGWSADWMPGLVDYARQRNVGVWIWVHWTGLDTAAERDAKLPLWRSWGVAGLKIDFMESDGQERMRWYDAISEATARHRLLVNFHGGTIPRGTERTWPHVMMFEAVRGAEGIKPRPGRLPYPVRHYTTLPFTRNLAGSMDFTPVTFSAVRDITDGAELALSVVFESGVQNFADSVESYAARPAAERLLREVPAAWDETRLLSGDPAGHVLLARRGGTGWFVGAVTAGAARTMPVPLDFLPAGDWLADIYADGPGGTLTVRTERVSGGTLNVPVPTNGGFTMQFCPATPGATACSPPVSKTRLEAERARISQGAVEANHSGFSGTGFVNYANVTGSFVEWTVNAATAGPATLTVRFANGATTDRPMDIRVNGIVTAAGLPFPGTGAWTTWQSRAVTVPLHAGPNLVRATAITAAGGPNVDYLDVTK